MAKLALVGPTYQDESLAADAQMTLNMYPEANDSGNVAGSAASALYQTPGYYLLCTMSGGAGCCIVPADTYIFPDGTTPAYFCINGNTLSYIAISVSGPSFVGTETVIGTVDEKPLQGSQLFPAQIIVLNPKLLFVVTNGKGYVAAFGSAISGNALNQGGASYAVGDTGIIDGAEGIDATYVVNTVDVNGAVLTYTLSYAGVGYSVGTDIGTLAFGSQPGIGTGFTIDISSVGGAAWVVQQQAIPATDTAFNNYINSATYMDGYVIVSMAPQSPDPLRRQFFVSGLNDPSFWDPLEVGEKEGNPDPIIAVFAAYELLGLFGSQTLELWYDSGNVQFQFSRIAGGGVIENGLASPWTITKADGTVIWLGTDIRGQNVAWQLQGMTPVRISNHAVEAAWRDYNMVGASCYDYQENGHFFCVFNFPIPDTTWVYDSVTKMWHQRASFDGSNFHSSFGRYHAFAQNVGHVLQDCNNGNVYLADQGLTSENGTPITRIRRTPHLRKELARAVLDRVRLLVDAGGSAQGLGGGLISLRISYDGGNTWGPYMTMSMGATGVYTQLIQWYHLGYSRDFVLEISSNSEVFQGWIEGYGEYRFAENHD